MTDGTVPDVTRLPPRLRPRRSSSSLVGPRQVRPMTMGRALIAWRDTLRVAIVRELHEQLAAADVLGAPQRVDERQLVFAGPVADDFEERGIDVVVVQKRQRPGRLVAHGRRWVLEQQHELVGGVGLALQRPDRQAADSFGGGRRILPARSYAASMRRPTKKRMGSEMTTTLPSQMTIRIATWCVRHCRELCLAVQYRHADLGADHPGEGGDTADDQNAYEALGFHAEYLASECGRVRLDEEYHRPAQSAPRAWPRREGQPAAGAPPTRPVGPEPKRRRGGRSQRAPAPLCVTIDR